MGKQTIEELEAQVKQLAAERDAVVAENAALKKAVSEFNELYGQGLNVANWHLNGDLEPLDNFFDENDWNPETPDTDAILASLRAEAIEFAAYHLPNNGKYEDMILTLADEVREGLTKVKIPAPKYERSQSEQVKGVQS